MVGTELMAHFVGYKIEVEAVPFRDGGGGVSTPLLVVGTDRPDITGIAGLARAVEEVADIVCRGPNPGGKRILHFRAQIAAERIGCRVGVDYLVVGCDQLQAYGQIALENLVDARNGGIDGGQWQLPMPQMISVQPQKVNAARPSEMSFT